MTSAGSSAISADTYGQGNAGDIQLFADDMQLSGGGISSASHSSSLAAGSAGSVVLEADADIALSDGLLVSTQMQGGGAPANPYNWGTITVSAGGSLTLDGAAGISASVAGNSLWALSENASSITVTVGDLLSLSGASFISADTGAGSSDAGNITVAAGVIDMNSGSSISSSTQGPGDAGSITLTASSLDLSDSALSSRSASTALNAGTAGSITLDTGAGGGNILLTGMDIDTSIKGGLAEVSAVANINVNSGGSLTVDNSTVNAATAGTGGGNGLRAPSAGTIALTAADSISLTGSTLSSQSTSDAATAGSAGNIAITAPNAISVNDTGISTEIHGGPAGDNGAHGNISLAANGQITVTGAGGTITASTFGSGDADDISIQSAAGAVSLDAAAVESNSTAVGRGGNAGTVSIGAAGALTLGNAGSIATNTASTGNAGDISLTAAGMDLSGSAITSKSTATDNNAGSAGAITLDTVAAGGDINLDGMTIDTSILGGLTGTVANIGIHSGGALTADNSTITAGNLRISGGAVTAGNVTLDAARLDLANTAISSSSDSSATNAGSAGSVALFSGTDIALTAVNVSTDVDGGQKGGGQGNITVSAANGAITLAQAASITATASGDTDAGTVTVTAGKDLQLNDQSYLSTDTDGANGAGGPGSHSGTGDAGQLTVTANNIAINPGSYISSSTQGPGAAGHITIDAENDLTLLGMGDIPIDQLGRYVATDFTGIRSSAGPASGGQSGAIDITAGHEINLDNGAQISISNEATVAAPSLLTPTAINLTAPSITLTGSQIVADSGGNVDAGDITINFEDTLSLDPSAISTVANAGNGGDITINGGYLIYLQDSEIITSVLGTAGNGGDISITADYLIMDTGFIQANTAAEGATGGLVNIEVAALIPSGSLLYLGGDTPYQFQPYSGINVIQAAAPGGVSGTINVTNPQLNLSGTLANLIIPAIDPNALSRNMCAAGDDSSLLQTGKGGLRRRAKDALVAAKL